MASSLVKSNRMKRLESKKSHSWWWDSHISPKNSRWLHDNLEEMDQNVKRMLKLIEEDADSFAKKAELYFKRRPELVALAEEFYRMYRSLAERYDHVTGELKKNIPSDLQSQGSSVSDVGSEPPSDTKPVRTKSGPRAAGFDFFLGSGGSCSDLNSKEGDESSTLDSESESDDSSVNNYSTNGDEQVSRRRIIELETELHATKEKLREEISNGFKKCDHDISKIEDELRVAKENVERSNEEIMCLKTELRKYETLGDSNEVDSYGNTEATTQELIQENAEKKLRESEEAVETLKRELATKNSSEQTLQEQLKSAQREVAVWKNKVEKEKREIARLQDRIVRYKQNLSERDQEIRGLKETIGNANKALSEENEQLQVEMKRMTKERAYLEDNLKEMDLRCQFLDDELRRVKLAKTEMEAAFGVEIEQLKADVAERDDRIKELDKNLDELNAKITELGAEIRSKDEHLQQLHLRHVELLVSDEAARKSMDELQGRVAELEKEVETKEEAILEAAEEKREAIRQLCFSIEHYRGSYHELRRAVMVR